MRAVISALLALLLAGAITSCAPANPIQRTKFNFEFPFEPSSPGYIVDISSRPITANLMCALEPDKTIGYIINLDKQATDKSLGECDTKSMTLTVPIETDLTVTVILGGFPLIRESGKSPDRIANIADDPTCSSCRQVEYDLKITRP
jgi:hypothetical protein